MHTHTNKYYHNITQTRRNLLLYNSTFEISLLYETLDKNTPTDTVTVTTAVTDTDTATDTNADKHIDADVAHNHSHRHASDLKAAAAPASINSDSNLETHSFRFSHIYTHTHNTLRKISAPACHSRRRNLWHRRMSCRASETALRSRPVHIARIRGLQHAARAETGVDRPPFSATGGRCRRLWSHRPQR